jgi:hypothetical protein
MLRAVDGRSESVTESLCPCRALARPVPRLVWDRQRDQGRYDGSLEHLDGRPVRRPGELQQLPMDGAGMGDEGREQLAVRPVPGITGRFESQGPLLSEGARAHDAPGDNRQRTRS